MLIPRDTVASKRQIFALSRVAHVVSRGRTNDVKIMWKLDRLHRVRSSYQQYRYLTLSPARGGSVCCRATSRRDRRATQETLMRANERYPRQEEPASSYLEYPRKGTRHSHLHEFVRQPDELIDPAASNRASAL